MFPTTPLNRPLRVAFFGTPEFAAICLETLLESHHRVVGVVTAPDRKAGRGQQLQASAVKTLAESCALPLLQPTNLKARDFHTALEEWHADVFIVVAFRMLPASVWQHPPFGTINLHASLLPNLRGAAPIQWALMHGLTSTGVTTFSLQHAIDTGDILLQDHTEILPEDDAHTLHEKLLSRGKRLIVETLDALVAGHLTATPQIMGIDSSERLEAPKLHRENTRIDWGQTTGNVLNTIRGLYPFPKAWTPSPHGDLKVLKASVSHSAGPEDAHTPAGTARRNGQALQVKCANGWLNIDQLTPPGKRPMSGIEWLNGLNDAPGCWGT